jgi:hypothetical protein
MSCWGGGGPVIVCDTIVDDDFLNHIFLPLANLLNSVCKINFSAVLLFV